MKITLLNRSDARGVIYVAGHDAEDYSSCRTNIALIKVEDWNAQLSPWPAPACFKGSEDFAGGADDFLNEIHKSIPAFEEENGFNDPVRGIMGYSLAGLFAVYALLNSDLFTMAASVSGSLWFENWIEYAKANADKTNGKSVYLSVGSREKKTRNIRLADVEKNMYLTEEIFSRAGAKVFSELNDGGHFVNDNARMIKAIRHFENADNY